MIQKRSVFIGVVVLAILVGGSFLARYSFGGAVEYRSGSDTKVALETGEAEDGMQNGSASSTALETGTDGAVDCSRVKCIALTIDDGPKDFTPKVLDILEEKDVKVTFFIWGAKYASVPMIARAAKAGMEIGNHTWNHKHLPTLSDAEVRAQIEKTADSIEKVTGKRPALFRPPFGDYDDRVQKIIGEEGEAIIMWNIDPEDWNHETEAGLINFFKDPNNLKRNGIIDMHSRKDLVGALPAVIDELQAQGYTLVTVSELIGKENLKPGVAYTSREGERS